MESERGQTYEVTGHESFLYTQFLRTDYTLEYNHGGFLGTLPYHNRLSADHNTNYLGERRVDFDF